MLKVQFTLMQDVVVQRNKKMQRVIRDNQPLIVEGEDEDRIHHDKQDEEDDDLVYMREHAQQDNDDDDNEEQPITVMQPRYTEVIETFGQRIRADDIAPPGPNVENQPGREQPI